MAQQCTLAELLRQRAKEQAESAAFIFRGAAGGRCVLSWSRLYRLAGRWAALLHNRGLGRGQLVVNTLVNSPERAVCEAGLWLSGAASVNGHCQMSDGSDLLHTMSVSRASAIIVDPDVSNSPWRVLNRYVSLTAEHSVMSEVLPHLKHVLFIRRVQGTGVEEGEVERSGVEGGEVKDFLSNLEASTDWFHADNISPEDILTVFTTSGTTGFSKLVVFTNSDFIQPLQAAIVRYEQSNAPIDKMISKPACILQTAPLGWLGGYVGLGVVDCGVRVACDVRVAGIPNNMPEFICSVIQEEQCSAALIAPMYLPGVAHIMKSRHERSISVHDPQSTAVNKMEYIILGGMPVTRAMVKSALSLAHAACIAYGATDFGYVSGFIVTDSENYVDFDTGPVGEGVSVKIVSQDNEDTVLPVNQQGHILAKGKVKQPRYLTDDPEFGDLVTCTKDGYIRTHDVGRLDERGHLIVHGRGSDAIMRGPYIFYPTWMETCIRACPGVCDVIITGVPEPDIHEELCACVVLESDSVTLQQVRSYVEKVVVTTEDDPLSPRPRYYLQFESFPVTDAGKPRRRAIKAQAVERLMTSPD